MNDGLALPAVLAFGASLIPGTSHFVWWRFVTENIVLGLLIGIAVGLVAAMIMPRERGLGVDIPPHQRALYALGTAFVAYGLTIIPPHGNGLIAVFVAAITLGIRRPDARTHFAHSEDIVEIVKIGVFVVFGSLLTVHGLLGDSWAALGIVILTLLVARPIGVFVALVGTATDVATRAFMAWFGPKGVATVSFSLLVLAQHVAGAIRIFNIAALVVFCSIIAHGLTDTAGAEWIAARAERESARRHAADADAVAQ